MRFPKGQHDDIVDALSIIGRGLDYVNSAQTGRVNRGRGIFLPNARC